MPHFSSPETPAALAEALAPAPPSPSLIAVSRTIKHTEQEDEEPKRAELVANELISPLPAKYKHSVQSNQLQHLTTELPPTQNDDADAGSQVLEKEADLLLKLAVTATATAAETATSSMATKAKAMHSEDSVHDQSDRHDETRLSTNPITPSPMMALSTQSRKEAFADALQHPHSLQEDAVMTMSVRSTSGRHRLYPSPIKLHSPAPSSDLATAPERQLGHRHGYALQSLAHGAAQATWAGAYPLPPQSHAQPPPPLAPRFANAAMDTTQTWRDGSQQRNSPSKRNSPCPPVHSPDRDSPSTSIKRPKLQMRDRDEHEQPSKHPTVANGSDNDSKTRAQQPIISPASSIERHDEDEANEEPPKQMEPALQHQHRHPFIPYPPPPPPPSYMMPAPHHYFPPPPPPPYMHCPPYPYFPAPHPAYSYPPPTYPMPQHSYYGAFHGGYPPPLGMMHMMPPPPPIPPHANRAPNFPPQTFPTPPSALPPSTRGKQPPSPRCPPVETRTSKPTCSPVPSNVSSSALPRTLKVPKNLQSSSDTKSRNSSVTALAHAKHLSLSGSPSNNTKISTVTSTVSRGSLNRCIPLPNSTGMPRGLWSRHTDYYLDMKLPDFNRLVNFPDYLARGRAVDSTKGNTNDSNTNEWTKEGKKHCVMCGELRTCSANTHINQHRNAGMDSDSRVAPASLTSAEGDVTGHIIPRQNKGVCTACDVAIWLLLVEIDHPHYHPDDALEIKWCKGCKNFRPWAAFGDKGMATKCVRCRTRQREKYALQKSTTGTTATTTTTIPTLSTAAYDVCGSYRAPHNEDDENDNFDPDPQDDMAAQHLASMMMRT